MRLQLEEAVQGCGEANWDGYGADPVIPSSVEWADRLLQALGSSVPRPEIGVAPDGHIVIEWIGGRGRVLSVDVGPAGEIHFAMRGPTTKLTGTASCTGGIPPALTEALAVVLS